MKFYISNILSCIFLIIIIYNLFLTLEYKSLETFKVKHIVEEEPKKPESNASLAEKNSYRTTKLENEIEKIKVFEERINKVELDMKKIKKDAQKLEEDMEEDEKEAQETNNNIDGKLEDLDDI